MDTFSKCLNRVFLSLCLFFGGGIVATSFAGPASLPDYSKGKNPVIEETVPVCDPRWYISIGGGIDVDLGGTDLTHNFDRDFNSFFLGFFQTASRAEMQSHDWNDAFNDAWRIQGEVGYALTQHLEVFGLFKYAHADSDGQALGSRLFIGGSSPVFLSSTFTDYNAWGGELGFRFYFTPRASHFRPYVSVSGGASHVDSIDMETRADFSGFFSGSPNVLVYKGGFFNDSWVGAGTALLGAEFTFACHWAVGVNGGVHYETRLDQNDDDFRNAFVGGLFDVPRRPFRQYNDDSGDRWTAPVTGYLKFRF